MATSSESKISISVDPPSQQSATAISRYVPTAIDIWSFGLSIVLGGQYIAWNSGLHWGVGTFFLSTMLNGTSYFCLVLCVSEISSALPFAGGSYGLARCSVGFFPGFLVGCFEAIEYMLYVSATVLILAEHICNILSISSSYEPIFWVLFYSTAIFIQSRSSIVFWNFNKFASALVFTLLVIFCVGAISHGDLKNSFNSHGEWGFKGGAQSVVATLPITSWFYVGVESLYFTSDVVDKPKTSIPWGSIACMFTLLITSVAVILSTVSMPIPLERIAHENTPFSPSYEVLFGISSRAADILSIPAIYITAWGFIYPFAKLLHSMAESNLLPLVLKSTLPNGAPHASMIAGSIFGLLICVIAKYAIIPSENIFSASILFGYLAYAGQLVGFLVLKKKLTMLSRDFTSPLGVYGAYYGLFIFTCGIVAVLGYNDSKSFCIVILVLSFIILTLYYVFVAQTRQTFSEEERTVLFRAHFITYTKANKARLRHENGNRESDNSYKSISSQSNISWKQISVQMKGSVVADMELVNQNDDSSESEIRPDTHRSAIESASSGSDLLEELSGTGTGTGSGSGGQMIVKDIYIRDTNSPPPETNSDNSNNQVFSDNKASSISSLSSCAADSQSSELKALNAQFQSLRSELLSYCHPSLWVLNENIQPSKFERCKVIGQGQFGKLCLGSVSVNEAENVKYRNCFMKFYEKRKIIDLDRFEKMAGEQRIYAWLNSSYIVSYYGIFQTLSNFVLCFEPLMHGDLFQIIHDATSIFGTERGLPANVIAQYSASIICALDHIHEKGIVYRDLKPENIMITSSGSIKLVDFKLAKQLPKTSDLTNIVKTFTICGTPEYISPEQILNIGHNQRCDLWSLGILIFEMFFNETPFVPKIEAHRSDSIYEIFSNIMRVKQKGVQIPMCLDLISGDSYARFLISQLLQFDPADRLDFEDDRTMSLVNHRFFDGINKSELVRGTLKSAYIPQEILK